MVADRLALIGLHGARGAGKDTAADYLHRQHDFWRLAFADPIREMLTAGFGLPPEVWAHPTKEQPRAELNGRTPRRVMQTLGTEWAQDILGRDIWVQVMARRVDRLFRAGVRRIVITDVRFEHEAMWLQERQAPIWRVERPGHHFANDHGSEVALPPEYVSAWVSNHDLTQFHRSLEQLLDSVL